MVPDNTIKVRGLKSASFTYRSVKVINKISNIKISNTMICKKKNKILEFAVKCQRKKF